VEVSQSEEKDPASENTPPSPLKYLDNDCPRARIESLVNLMISQSNGNELLTDMLNLCERYGLERLAEILVYPPAQGDS